MLAAALFGEARALAIQAGSIAEARELIAGLADGRFDLVAQEAGLPVGYWSASVARQHPIELLAAGLLIMSGPVDLATVARWVEIERQRGAAPMYRAR